MKYIFLSLILFCTACASTSVSKKEWFNKEISKYGLTASDTLVDIGCGNGLFDAIIASYYPKACFVMEDVLSSVEKPVHTFFPPKETAGKHCPPVFVLGTDTTIPLPSNQYRIIICHKTVHELTHPDAMILEMKRIMRKDGTIIIVERPPAYLGETDKYCKQQYLTKEAVVTLLEKNGLKLLDIQHPVLKKKFPVNIFFCSKS